MTDFWNIIGSAGIVILLLAYLYAWGASLFELAFLREDLSQSQRTTWIVIILLLHGLGLAAYVLAGRTRGARPA